MGAKHPVCALVFAHLAASAAIIATNARDFFFLGGSGLGFKSPLLFGCDNSKHDFSFPALRPVKIGLCVMGCRRFMRCDGSRVSAPVYGCTCFPLARCRVSCGLLRVCVPAVPGFGFQGAVSLYGVAPVEHGPMIARVCPRCQSPKITFGVFNRFAPVDLCKIDRCKPVSDVV